ncbi:MAG: asparagine synthase (glutamine-hydrolyzing) [Vicinamibacterales bacterium]
MCGIAGRVQFDGSPLDIAWLRRACAALTHRGPDGTTVHAYDPQGPARDAGAFGASRVAPGARAAAIGLGHCRLRIIDLSSRADQPLGNAGCVAAGRATPVTIVFNGEIYNYRELRADLEERGHRFASASDTEVVLHLYEEEGERLLARLRGMFAFALWDEAAQRLFCARDRVGKKPFYYHAGPRAFSFASTPRALLTDAGIPEAIDPAAIAHYLTLGYVAGPGSAFASLSRLPPAHYLVASAAGVRTERYWDLPYRPKARVDEREALVEFRSIFEESVRLRLISDVPLGAFLSGGIDSAATVAAMSLEASGGVETFSIGFDDPRYDELPGARLVADRFHTRHHEFVVRPQAASIVDTLAWHYGEPFADSSAVPSYYLAELARKEITVALTGDGGDESFAGYRRYGAHRLATRLRAVPRPVLRTLARTVALLPAAERTRSRLYDVRRFVAALAAETGERYRGWFGFFDPDSPVVAADLRRAHGRVAAERLGAWFDRLRDEDPVDQAMGVDLHSYLPDDLLVKADIATMAHGLEARSPLLDHRVMEFAARLPVSLKRRGTTTKYLVRTAMATTLPPEILRGAKRGFGVPLDDWFRGPLGDMLDDALGDANAPARAFVDVAEARRVLGDHRAHAGAHGHRLWALLMLDRWLRSLANLRTATSPTMERPEPASLVAATARPAER